MKELLEEVRVDAVTKVIGIPKADLKEYENREDFCNGQNRSLFVALHLLPLDVLAKIINPLLKSVCANSQMILMKLYSPKEVNATDPSEYMKNLRNLVKDLPPMLLMNSSTHLPVITRYIWYVSC